MTLVELLNTEEYLSLSNADAAALINQKRHAGPSVWKYKSLSSTQGVGLAVAERLTRTMNGVADDVNHQYHGIVGEMRNELRGSGSGIDINDANTQLMLDAFAADGNFPLTADDAAAIKALAENQVSDAELYGLGVVQEKHVRWARGN